MAILTKAPNNQKMAATGAFLIMALSPSYLDWEQSPDKHKQIVGFYAVAIGLFWYGFLK
jgi:hypothetical protein